MHTIRKMGIACVAASALMATAAPATAAPAPGPAAKKACSEEVYYTVKSKKVVSLWAPGTHFVDGKGGTVQGRVERSWSKSSSLEKGAEASIGAVWATVKGNVSKTVTKSNSVTVGHWYSHNISKKKYGHIRYRVIGYKVLIWKMRELRSCKVKFLDAFYGTFVTDKEGWKYWESTKP